MEHMKRRVLLTALGTTVVSGCLGRGDGALTKPAAVSSYSYDRLLPEGDRYEDAPARGQRPVVELATDDSGLTILGTVEIGSPECNTSTLDALSLDDGTLGVTLATTRTDRGSGFTGACSAAEGADRFALTVAFATALPTALDLTLDEQGDGGAQYSYDLQGSEQ